MIHKGRRIYNIIIVCLILFIANSVHSQNITDSLIRKYERSTDDLEKLKTAVELVKKNQYTDSTILFEYSEKALQLSQKLNNNVSKGYVYLKLGYYYSQRNMLKALDYANKSRSAFLETDRLNQLSSAYSLFGTIYYYFGNYSKSLENYYESLKINEKLNDKENLASSYNNVAIIYAAQENKRKALEFYFKALSYNKKYGQPNSSSLTLMNISITYGDIDSVEQELRYGKMALDTARKYDDRNVLSQVLLNLGDVYINKKDFANAQRCLEEAEGIFVKSSSRYLLNYLFWEKGTFYKAKNDPRKAIEYYLLTLNNAKSEGFKHLIQISSQELSKIYKSQNNYKEGLYYFEIFHSISDSISNIEKTKKITEVELQYLFDKQMEVKRIKEESRQKKLSLQRSIIIIFSAAMILAIALIILIIKSYRSKQKSYLVLSEQNSKIQKQNDAIREQSEELREQRDQLKQLNITKDKINSIIAHDLKNPFNSILGFTALIKERWNDIEEEKKQFYISKVNESATNAYELLENLLEWSRMQTGKLEVKAEFIELKTHIDDTIYFVMGQAKSKNIEIFNLVKPDIFISADKNMIGSVVRNILSNAIKFTKENGAVKITCENHTKDCLSIIFEDNGIGMSEETIKNLFDLEKQESTYGTNNEKGTGLGLIVCKEFIEKNNGRIDVESKLGEGSRFAITFPKC